MNVASVYERISAAYEALSSFRTSLRDLAAGDFPSENPKILLEILSRLSDALEFSLSWQYAEQARVLSQEASSSRTEEDLEHLEYRVSAIVEAAARLTPIARHIDDARNQLIPGGLVSQLERLTRCVAEDSRVLVSPRWEYNYTYSSINAQLQSTIGKLHDLDQTLYQALALILKDYPKFFALSFPSTQTENVLQTATWAHELGHFVDNLEGERLTQNSAMFLSDEVIRGMRITLTDEESSQLLDLSLSGGEGVSVSSEVLDAWRSVIMRIVQSVRGWSKEIFADIFAIRLLGPAALFGFCDLALFLYPDLDASGDLQHPPLRHRLRLMMDELDRWSASEHWVDWQPAQCWADFVPAEEKKAVQRALHSISERTRTPRRVPPGSSPASGHDESQVRLDEVIKRTTEHIVDQVASAIRSEIEQIIKRNPSTCYLMPSHLFGVDGKLAMLSRSIPTCEDPVQDGRARTGLPDQVQLALNINAGWFFWLTMREYPERASDETFDTLHQKRMSVNRLVLKSIELFEAKQWYATRRRLVGRPSAQSSTDPDILAQGPRLGGVLGRREILRRLKSPLADVLVVTPLLSASDQIGAASIDIRLGNEFVATKHTRLQTLDPTDQQIGLQISQYQTKFYVPFGRSFVLHPQQFVLGDTLEYICLPDDVTGLVLGRSSWGRLGLIIATASKVDPGFKGVLTLELVNLGNVPILLYPGSRIAQLSLYNVCGNREESQ